VFRPFAVVSTSLPLIESFARNSSSRSSNACRSRLRVPAESIDAASSPSGEVPLSEDSVSIMDPQHEPHRLAARLLRQ
jgi:hypothetical protein